MVICLDSDTLCILLPNILRHTGLLSNPDMYPHLHTYALVPSCPAKHSLLKTQVLQLDAQASHPSYLQLKQNFIVVKYTQQKFTTLATTYF